MEALFTLLMLNAVKILIIKKNLVECGVCDGLTFYIMAHVLILTKLSFKATYTIGKLIFDIKRSFILI